MVDPAPRHNSVDLSRRQPYDKHLHGALGSIPDRIGVCGKRNIGHGVLKARAGFPIVLLTHSTTSTWGVTLGLAVLGLALVLFGCAPAPIATPVPRPGPLVSREPVTPDLNTSSPAGPATPSPLPTARTHHFDDVDEAQILKAVFPDFTLTAEGDGYRVNGSPNWTVWVNDREEGYVTQAERPELVAVIASQVNDKPPPEEEPYGPSGDFLAIIERRDGKLVLTQRASLSPAVSPLASDVRIERSVEMDRDNRDELLVTTNSVQTLVIRTVAHLYRWEGEKLVELWQGVEQDDNTAAVNQSEYSTYQALIDFADVNNDGRDEIIVNGRRSVYPKDSEGRADLTAPSSVSTGREVYKWNGTSFALDPGLTTPMAPEKQTP
jgi:hypothetical protein